MAASKSLKRRGERKKSMEENVNSMSPQFTLLDQLWDNDLSIQWNCPTTASQQGLGKTWRLELESRKTLPAKGSILCGKWSSVSGGTG